MLLCRWFKPAVVGVSGGGLFGIFVILFHQVIAFDLNFAFCGNTYTLRVLRATDAADFIVPKRVATVPRPLLSFDIPQPSQIWMPRR